MKLRLLAAASLVALAGTAQAADLPDTFIEPVVTVVAPSWTGGYVGLYGGYSFENDEDDDGVILFDTNLDGAFGDVIRTAAGADAFAPGFCDGLANGPRPVTAARTRRTVSPPRSAPAMTSSSATARPAW